jgi:hypothetical protein
MSDTVALTVLRSTPGETAAQVGQRVDRQADQWAAQLNPALASLLARIASLEKRVYKLEHP